MKRLAEILRWPWWTVTTARHRDDDQLAAGRPTWTPDELAALPHIAPERPLDGDTAAERGEIR